MFSYHWWWKLWACGQPQLGNHFPKLPPKLPSVMACPLMSFSPTCCNSSQLLCGTIMPKCCCNIYHRELLSPVGHSSVMGDADDRLFVLLFTFSLLFLFSLLLYSFVKCISAYMVHVYVCAHHNA